MKRILVGGVIILHALAHSNIAIWASASGPAWFINALWAMAMIGYLAAGLGLLRIPLLRDNWKQLMLAATVASLVLLVFTGTMPALIGAVIDVVLLVLVFEWAQRNADADVRVADAVGADGLGHPWLHRVGWSIGALFFLYVTTVVAARPFFMRWGTTSAERSATLPGDGLVSDPRYRIDHGITIHAPADSVWPWLAQLGQDRGGFYSYSWLERLVGDRIQNADRIHPEWQTIKPGDLVRAVQPDYLGGRFGDLGWRVLDVVPGRALVLENWGAFVVQPVDATTSRFFVRTRGPGTPSLVSLVFGPLNVLVLEPAHFIMERGMLRGVRARAEEAARRG